LYLALTSLGCDATTRKGRSNCLRARAHPRLATWVRRHGPLAGLVGWAPLVGDPCTILCGVLRVPFVRFTLYSLLARFARYAVIWLGVLAG
jgi:membrane protein YqaA with SNARE-associated domain